MAGLRVAFKDIRASATRAHLTIETTAKEPAVRVDTSRSRIAGGLVQAFICVKALLTFETFRADTFGSPPGVVALCQGVTFYLFAKASFGQTSGTARRTRTAGSFASLPTQTDRIAAASAVAVAVAAPSRAGRDILCAGILLIAAGRGLNEQ